MISSDFKINVEIFEDHGIQEDRRNFMVIRGKY